MARSDEVPNTSPQEIEALIERVKSGEHKLPAKDVEMIERLLRSLLVFLRLLQQKNQTILKLRAMIFGPRTEKREKHEQKSEEPPGTEESGKSEVLSNENRALLAEPESPEALKKAKRKGHGRRAASDYPGAKVVPVRHEKYRPGSPCDDPLCGGRLYDPKETREFLQFTGQPLITATKYEREVLRCAKCRERLVAELPAGVKEERFDPTADATIAVMKTGGGLPWHRHSGLQTMFGVPLAESVLWERYEATADACLSIYLLLLRLAANGELMHTDDTWVRILSCLKEDRGKQKGEKRATQTSGFVIKSGGRPIALYFSGRKHAGENLADLLKQREAGLDSPLHMSDALYANDSHGLQVVSGKCLTHGRRPVFELSALEPDACSVVLNAIGRIYGYEAETDVMSAEERLRYHQEQSGPVMRALKEWIERQFADRRVEPNSSLGKALQYWLNNWDGLTKFLTVAGMPLDNNVVERALKQFILMRKNSLFFKTEHGAACGDILGSLIQTCRLNGINAWDYLATIIRNKASARRNPQRYLPWTYKGEEAEALAA